MAAVSTRKPGTGELTVSQPAAHDAIGGTIYPAEWQEERRQAAQAWYLQQLAASQACASPYIDSEPNLRALASFVLPVHSKCPWATARAVHSWDTTMRERPTTPISARRCCEFKTR